MNIVAAALGLVFFVATDYEHGRELWVSDGTKGGTRMVADISPGTDDTSIYEIYPARNGVIFVADLYTTTGGSALYFSDGTEDGTIMLHSDERPYILSFFGKVKNYYYFTPCNGGGELWYTDGTQAGTKQVPAPKVPAPKVPAPDSIRLHCYGSVHKLNRNSVFFVQPNWLVPKFVAILHNPKTNKVTKLPVKVTHNYYGKAVRAAVVNDRLIFVHFKKKHGEELWYWDQSMSKPKILKDIYPGFLGAFDPSMASYDYDGPIAHRGRAYFLAFHPDTGSELWATDGTKKGTHIVKDIVRGPDSANNYYWTTRNIRHAANNLLTLGTKLMLDVDGEYWTTNGKKPGTKRLNLETENGKEIAPTYGLDRIGVTNGLFFFEGSYPTAPGTCKNYDGDPLQTCSKSLLYSGDLKTHTVTPVKNINKDICQIPESMAGMELDHILSLATVGNSVLFSANNKLTPRNVSASKRNYCESFDTNTELWISDGTKNGTRKVKEIYPGVGGQIGKFYGHLGSNPDLLTAGGM